MNSTKLLLSVLAFLEALPLLLRGYDDVVAAARALSAKVREFVEQGRDPSEEEWNALDGQVQGLLAQLQTPPADA